MNASEFKNGFQLTGAIDETLSKAGFSTSFQKITPTGQDEFAGNLVIEIPSSADNEKSDFGAATSIRTNMIFAVMQEDFYRHSELFLEVLQEIKDQKNDFDVTFLFSASDKPLFETYFNMTGTEVFTSAEDDADSCFALVLSFDETKKTAVTTSCMYATSPLWLAKLAVETLAENNISFSYPHFISSIYRLGFVQGERRLTEFMQAEIPALSINLSSPETIHILPKLTKKYNPKDSSEWDKHYILFPAGQVIKSLYLTEGFLIHTCITVSIITILLVCSFSFLGAHRDLYKSQLFHSLYMIPLTITVSFISLFIGQKFTSSISEIANLNPIFQFGLKLFISMLFISVLFAFQETLRIPVTFFVYSYIISIVALFNIFFFTLCDILLFVPFLAEYIIILISRPARKFHKLVFFFVFMTIPFIPYAIIICSTANPDVIRKLVFTGILGNLFLSFAMFPFQIMWLKILVRLNIYTKSKNFTLKKAFVKGAVSTSAILTFIILIVSLFSSLAYKPKVRNESHIQTSYTLREENRNDLSLNISQDEFLGMKTNHIQIHSDEDALRYNVYVYGLNNEMPVYDSIYDYKVESIKIKQIDKTVDAVTFIIPDLPPRDIRIDYASYENNDIYILATAIYKTQEQGSYRTEILISKTGTKK